MPVIVCGVNHKTAPIALRERLVFPKDRLPLYLQDLLDRGDVEEAVLLSTCNRSELYGHGRLDAAGFQAWFAGQHGLTPDALGGALYTYEGVEAVEHMMSVACGLDSMVLGESQILGQMKAAFSESCAAGAVGPLFNRLFQQVFSVAKDVRTHTAIGGCPVSVSSAAVRFVAQTFPDALQQRSVLVVGAGLTIELVLRHLAPHGPGRLVMANRNPEHAATLASRFGARVCPLTRLDRAIAEADVVITATGSPVPVITPAMIADRARPLLMVDIAVPRDIDPGVAEIPLVSLYSLDDLRSTMEQGLNARQHAAEKAQEVIAARSRQFVAWMSSLDQVSTTIRAWRGNMEQLCRRELVHAERRLQRGEDPSDVLRQFAHALTQKMLHEPSVQLRQAGLQGRTDVLQVARELFALPEWQIS